jgi:hypothetical protein
MLPQLPLDKANHAIYGSVIFNVIFIICLVLHIANPILVGGIVVVVCAVGKEVLDAYQNYKISGDYRVGIHGVELPDALATVFGGILSLIPALLIKVL